MILDLAFLLILQPLFSNLFFFLPPLLFSFFNNELKKLNLQLFLYTFLADLIFIKPLGFFLLLTSFSFLLLSFLEKFLNTEKFFQRLIFIFLLNVIFILGFSFLGQIKLNLNFFPKIFLLNFVFQIIYIEIKKTIFLHAR